MDRATVCDVSKPAQEVESSPIATDPSANAPSELAMLLKSMELVRVLAAFLPGRTLEYFLELQRSEVVSSVGNARGAGLPRSQLQYDRSCRGRLRGHATGLRVFRLTLISAVADTEAAGAWLRHNQHRSTRWPVVESQ